ncbi:MAG TPA: hypothetical protein VF178_07385 [Gemmatimonadaceae bacterium]
MTRQYRSAALAGLALVCLPAMTRAQDDPILSLGLSVGTARERVRFADDNDQLSGATVGLMGGLDWGRARVRLAYTEGRLRSRADGSVRHDLVESSLFVGTQVVGGLELGGGLQARAYVNGGGTERWLLWQLRARYDAVMRSDIRAYAELWRSASGTVNAVNILRPRPGETGDGFAGHIDGKPVSKTFRTATGGEAGVVILGRGWRPTVRVGYAIDAARLDAGGYRDSIESLTLALSFDTSRHFD